MSDNGVGTGLVVAAGVFLSAVVAYGKGIWQVVSGGLKLRRELADGKVKAKAALIDTTQDAAMAMLLNLQQEYDRQKGENAELRDENGRLRQKVYDLTDTVHAQAVTIAEMDERLRRLEEPQ